MAGIGPERYTAGMVLLCLSVLSVLDSTSGVP